MAGKFKVEITEPAERDLEDILEYIVQEQSFKRAEVVIEKDNGGYFQLGEYAIGQRKSARTDW
ncbi:MAG: hypothetical protein WBA17_06170 [Saprospiraceae bacterium]